jgi:outer membrane protein assembly factor BamB
MNLGTVYAVNATTGAKLWSYVGSGGYASPTVANGVIYVSQDKLYALDASTGAALCSITNVSGGPFREVSVANGVTYASAGFPDTAVYTFDATTGAGLWSYATGDASGFVAGPVVANGMVFAASVGQEGPNSTVAGLHAFQPAIRPLGAPR